MHSVILRFRTANFGSLIAPLFQSSGVRRYGLLKLPEAEPGCARRYSCSQESELLIQEQVAVFLIPDASAQALSRAFDLRRLGVIYEF